MLVTGASSGLGAAMAERMAARGWRVFGTSRKPAPGEGPDPTGIEWIALDVCDDDSVAAGLAAIHERVEHLDGLVCNAGFGIYGSVEETSLERARAQFETNFFGVLRVLTPVLARMRARNAGRILLVGSLAGRRRFPSRPTTPQQRQRSRASPSPSRTRSHPTTSTSPDRAR